MYTKMLRYILIENEILFYQYGFTIYVLLNLFWGYYIYSKSA